MAYPAGRAFRPVTHNIPFYGTTFGTRTIEFRHKRLDRLGDVIQINRPKFRKMKPVLHVFGRCSMTRCHPVDILRHRADLKMAEWRSKPCRVTDLDARIFHLRIGHDEHSHWQRRCNLGVALS